MCESIPAASIPPPRQTPRKTSSIWKIGQMPGPAGSFHLQIPHPCSYYVGQMLGPQFIRPIYNIMIYESNVNSHMILWWICSRNETLWPDKDKTKGLIVIIGLLWSIFQNNGVWNPLTSEHRRKWWHDAMKQVLLLFGNARGSKTLGFFLLFFSTALFGLTLKKKTQQYTIWSIN